MTNVDPTAHTPIVFSLPEPALNGSVTETLWVEPTEQRGVVRILNTPFYVNGIAFLDLITVTHTDNQIQFESVVEHSGHSTYRIHITGSLEEDGWKTYWKQLEQLGCRYEESLKPHLLAIDVPPSADGKMVYIVLETGERIGVWQFDEGYYGQ